MAVKAKTIADNYVCVQDAAKMLGLSPQRIRALIHRKFDRRKRVIFAEKIGRAGWMIKRTEIEKFRKHPGKVGRPQGFRKIRRKKQIEGINE